jgi:hypothetical protein
VICACRIQKHEERVQTLSTAALKGIIQLHSTAYTGSSDIALKPKMYAQSKLIKVGGKPTLAIKLLLRNDVDAYDGGVFTDQPLHYNALRSMLADRLLLFCSVLGFMLTCSEKADEELLHRLRDCPSMKVYEFSLQAGGALWKSWTASHL